MNPYGDDFLDAVRASIPAMNIHAREGMPEEVVGLILDDGDLVRLINQARSKSRFTVSRSQLAEKLADINPDAHQVIAVYHSHPAGTTTLSPEDQTAMRMAWTVDGLTLPWVTIVPDSRLAVWWLDPHYHSPRSTIIRFDEEVAHA